MVWYQKRYQQQRYQVVLLLDIPTLLVSCLPNKKKTPKLFFFQLVPSLSLQNKTSTQLFFLGQQQNSVQTNGHGTVLFNKACLTSWVLLERKNTLRKLNLTFECQTDVLLNKKQKKRVTILCFSAVRSWNVSF